MKFECFFQTKESFLLQIWANRISHRWESGGSFASDWSEEKWYEGIILISKESVKWYFLFKMYEVRDSVLPDFSHQTLFGEMTNMEILSKCEQTAITLEKSPFTIVEIGREFIPISSEIPDSENLIFRGEDVWG